MIRPCYLLFAVALLGYSSMNAQGLSVNKVEALLDQERFHVFNLGEKVNSEFSEYNPVLSPDGRHMLYTSRSDTATGSNIYTEDRQYFEDINLAERREGNYAGVPAGVDPLGDFASQFNTNKHEAPVYISEGSSTIILFKDNDLWYSKLEAGGYTAPVRYPKNINFTYYHRHASLTADGKTMYFTAEMLDKKTERFHLDLYVTHLNDNGNWEKPTALPLPVNTLYDEDSPEVSADGKMLFFSSNRTGGKGGYDIYYVNLTQDSLTLKRLQGPINSAAHDIYFKLLPDGRNAYFSSNRLGGYGAMDIYKVSFYEAADDACDQDKAVQSGIVINGADTLLAGSRLLFNTRGSQIDGREPAFFDWFLNDSLIASGTKLNTKIDRPGNYQLELHAAAVDSVAYNFHMVCKSIPIVVLDEAAIQEGRSSLLEIPAENQLLSEQDLMDMLPKPTGAFKLANDVASTYADVPVLLSVFENDPAAISSNLKLVSITRPENGSAVINHATAGRILYYPSTSFVGNDGFSYKVEGENGKQATAWVGIRVLVNPHVAIDESTGKPIPDTKQTNTTVDHAITSAGRLVAINVFLNDRIADEENVKLTAITIPSNGAAQVYDAKEGTIVYAPNGSFTGEDEFTYTLKLENGELIQERVTVKVGERKPAVLAAVTPDSSDGGDVASQEQTNEVATVSESSRDVGSKSVKAAQSDDVVELNQVDKSKINTSDKPAISLDRIYFDFDESGIRKDAQQTMAANLKVLKANPKVVIQVVSHCDSWGSSAYNQLLSARRAKATVDYLIANGIDKERIIGAVGYGEEQLVNDCGDGVPCPISKHQQNRRSEFVVVGTLK